MLTTKQKIVSTIITILLIFGSIFIYFHFKSNTNPLTPSTPSQTVNNIIDQASKNTLPPSYKGMYLYSTKNNTLYLLSTDQKFYDAGSLLDCPNVKSEDVSSYEISDITKLYNCLSPDLPDQYKSQCSGKNGWISVVLKSADELENYIKQNISGTITPDVNICYTTIKTDDGNDVIIKPSTTIEDFLINNKDGILQLVATGASMSENAIVSAVGKYVSYYFIIVMTIEGFLSSSKVTRLQTGIMTSQMIVQHIIPILTEAIGNYIEKEAPSIIENTGGNIMKVCGEEVALKCVSALTTQIGELAISLLSGVGQILSVVGNIQIFGMILDMIDPCNLNDIGNNLTQEFMDSIQKSSDITLNINTGGLLKTPWDPLKNYCDFGLIDPSTCGKRYTDCSISSISKNNIRSADDYCKDITDKFNKYKSEYLDNLTVNSLGQCIKKDFSNQDLANLFKKCVGGNVNWDIISKIDQTNYPSSLLPSNNILKELDVYFVNHNTVVQMYLNKYWYLVAGFFSILGVTLLAL